MQCLCLPLRDAPSDFSPFVSNVDMRPYNLNVSAI